MKRYINIKTFMIATILFMAVQAAFAQRVPIPNPTWPLDSVVNWSVHRYQVPGDENYRLPSRFVWKVSGGELYYDAEATMMAGDGLTDTVVGNARNQTSMFVRWDIGTALDTGYVYVWEISADGCERSSKDFGKYVGMRIKISAPPKVRFLANETIICSYDDSARVFLEIEGMPPYDIVYALNGETHNMHVTSDDLYDWDGDGEINNVSFLVDGMSGITSDTVIYYQLLEASSGGVPGDVLPDFPDHTVIGHVQPPAPQIFPSNQEVTRGNTRNYSLLDRGVNPQSWHWQLFHESNAMVYEAFLPNIDVAMNFDAAQYYWQATYIDNFGCLSLPDSLWIEIFNQPYIMFSDSTPGIKNCSAVSLIPDEVFEFIVEYYGARSYSFTWEVYDYNGNLVDSGELEYQTYRQNIIAIENNFINDELPPENRPWKVVITSADNEESDVEVLILDSDIEGGRDERIIMIHPKPIILDDIDFAN